jgi:hypothetical protein
MRVRPSPFGLGCRRELARAARHSAGCSPAAVRVRSGCIRVSPCSCAFARLEQAGRERRPGRVLGTTLSSSLLQAYTRSTEREYTRCCLTLPSSGPPPAWPAPLLRFMFRCAGQVGSDPLMSNVRPQRSPSAWLSEQEFRGSLNPVRLTRALRADALRRAVSPNKFLVSARFPP